MPDEVIAYAEFLGISADKLDDAEASDLLFLLAVVEECCGNRSIFDDYIADCPRYQDILMNDTWLEEELGKVSRNIAKKIRECNPRRLLKQDIFVTTYQYIRDMPEFPNYMRDMASMLVTTVKAPVLPQVRVLSRYISSCRENGRRCEFEVIDKRNRLRFSVLCKYIKVFIWLFAPVGMFIIFRIVGRFICTL